MGIFLTHFKEDLPVEANQEEEFIAAMIRARDEDVPIQVFQDLLKEAPPVSVVDLYLLTVRFLALGHKCCAVTTRT
jgi:hypothetical protein